jgi:hypothetical protein
MDVDSFRLLSARRLHLSNLPGELDSPPYATLLPSHNVPSLEIQSPFFCLVPSLKTTVFVEDTMQV